MNWKAISYSAASDSQATVIQVIRNNAARKAACEAGGGKTAPDATKVY